MPSELANFEGEMTLSKQMTDAKEKSQPKLEKSFTEDCYKKTSNNSQTIIASKN